MSGDVETNPEPETLDFCTWNLNSIYAHDSLRVSLLEAYNSVCNYDLIGIVESHLDKSIDETRLALNGYTLTKANYPQNVKMGGVGLYIKDSLSSPNRPDLVTLHECIVYEIQVNNKKYFFSVIYRCPSQGPEDFETFTANFELALAKMQAGNPFITDDAIITDDFHQLISEPTHLMGDSKSCIDLIFIDQHNLVIDSGVHPSLHEQCHHQIVFGKLSVSNITLPK